MIGEPTPPSSCRTPPLPICGAACLNKVLASGRGSGAGPTCRKVGSDKKGLHCWGGQGQRLWRSPPWESLFALLREGGHGRGIHLLRRLCNYERDLVLLVDNHLSLSQPCAAAAKEVNAILGCINRNSIKITSRDSTTLCCTRETPLGILSPVLVSMMQKRF